MDVPGLPFDILSEVAAHSPPSTIAKLMNTCHVLYADGPRHLLRGGVVLRRSVEVTPFVNFMFARDTARFAFLRKLDIAISTIDRYTEERLVRLLACDSLFLDTLIFRDAEAFVTSYPRVCDAISKPGAIKHLGLHYAGPRACSKFTAMSLQLTTATITLIGPIPSAGIETVNRDNELSVIAGSSLSLETLALNTQPATSVPGSSFPSHLDGYQFPAVRTLSIVCDVSYPECIITAPIARAFPNLSNLSLVPSQLPTTARCPTSDLHRDIERTRLANLQAQPLHPGNLWPTGLDEYAGELLSLYTFGLTRKVTTLRVWKRLDSVKFLPFLRTLLADTQPTHLLVSIRGLDVLEGFLLMLGEMEMERLRSIELNYASRLYDNDGSIPDPNCTMECVFNPLARLRPQVVELYLVLSDIAEPKEPLYAKFSETLRRRIAMFIPEYFTGITVRHSGRFSADWPRLDYEYDDVERQLNSERDLAAWFGWAL